jgi:hypothetical protein
MKANYKIFDKSTGKYVSKSRSKSTWTTRSWAICAGEDYARYMTHRNTRGLVPKDIVMEYVKNNLELHIFPLQDAIVTDLLTAIKEEELVKKERELKKKEGKEEYHRKLRIKELELKIAEITKELESLKK